MNKDKMKENFEKQLIKGAKRVGRLRRQYIPRENEYLASGTHGTCSWVVDEAGTLFVYPTSGVSGTLANQNVFNERANWANCSKIITEVVVEQGVYANTKAAFLFSGLNKCKYMDLSNLDVSQTENFNCMFDGCSNLKEVNLKNWNTERAITISGMFYKCHSLKDVDLSMFSTSCVRDMNGMFFECSHLKSLDLSSFDTTKVNNMAYMFAYCRSLRELVFPGFRDEKRKSSCEINNMFLECKNVKLDTTEKTNMTEEFIEWQIEC